MARRFLVIVVLVALASALMASSAQAVPGVDAGVKSRQSVSCAVQLAFYSKLHSLAMVRVIRAEYDDTAPSAADPDLVAWIQDYYGAGCGLTLDAYVGGRVSRAQFSWYRDVVAFHVPS